MINKTPPSLDSFPVPVAGQEIPRGWFARLVSFINSLVLHGDRQYFCVMHSSAGTTIEPTKMLIDLLSDRGGSAAASGATGIGASVSGGTASVTLTGGTGSVNLVGTGAVTISGNATTGDIEINATGGTGSAGLPDYATSPVTLSEATVYPADGPLQSDMWLIGTVGLRKTASSGFPAYVTLKILSTSGTTVVRAMDLFYDTGTFPSINSDNNFCFDVCRPVPAGYRVEVTKSGSATFNLSLYYT